MYQLDTEEIITQILGRATQMKNNKASYDNYL